MTRTDKLIKVCNQLYADNYREIDALEIRGPRGGYNAAYIDGWRHTGISVITRACNLSFMPTLPYWSGSLPTPSTEIPSCIADELIAAHKLIFG